jgi:hypothetical protein
VIYLASHFSSIGLPIKSERDFIDYFKKTVQNGQSIKTKFGTYLKWDVHDGVELWAQLSEQNEAIGLNPHYSGSSRMQVSLQSKNNQPNDTILDGGFYAFLGDSDENMMGEGIPFVFDAPNFAVYEGISLPQLATVQIAAFAHEIAVFESETEYFDSQDSEMKFAAESFIPSGLFSPDGEANVFLSAQAIFSGRILECQKKKNEFTCNNYWWIKVGLLGGEIDVVSDVSLLESQSVKVGGIVTGSFWLSGKIISK